MNRTLTPKIVETKRLSAHRREVALVPAQHAVTPPQPGAAAGSAPPPRRESLDPGRA